MTEQCEGERGPDLGDTRKMMVAASNVETALLEPQWRGWRMIGMHSAPVLGRGLPRMVTVTMQYVGKDT